jgi:hypothetical protein
MIDSKKNILFLFFFLVTVLSFAQEGTRMPSGAIPNGKIMLIPFEPKLYMSEMDMKINQQTNWNFQQIRENFRHQLDTQLKLKLKSIAPVVSFYSDSIQMATDLATIYKSTNLSYDLVEASTTPPPTKQKGITNGQITAEVNNDKKFMNTKLNDTKLLPYLNKKYKSEYFVFINQLDIKKDIDSYDPATDLYQREITVHYTIIDKSGKTISAGITTSRFSSKENDPKKIASSNFSSIGTYLTSILSANIKQSTAVNKKK